MNKVAGRQIILTILRVCPFSIIMPSSITGDTQRVTDKDSHNLDTCSMGRNI